MTPIVRPNDPDRDKLWTVPHCSEPATTQPSTAALSTGIPNGSIRLGHRQKPPFHPPSHYGYLPRLPTNIHSTLCQRLTDEKHDHLPPLSSRNHQGVVAPSSHPSCRLIPLSANTPHQNHQTCAVKHISTRPTLLCSVDPCRRMTSQNRLHRDVPSLKQDPLSSRPCRPALSPVCRVC
ncbi:hypothetical protein LX36DRAFT_655435 [Colletotrichum falcatum]|nr:hypothetical protein LX36DRAFT_655435 [Colletotrichum falcatum]